MVDDREDEDRKLMLGFFHSLSNWIQVIRNGPFFACSDIQYNVIKLEVIQLCLLAKVFLIKGRQLLERCHVLAIAFVILCSRVRP